MLRLVVGVAAQTLLLGAFLMVPAFIVTGGLAWPRGWQALAVLFVASLGGGLWALRVAPDLVRERTAVPAPQTRADALATLLIAVCVAGWFAFAAADALRLRLIAAPPDLTLAAGIAVFLAGLAMFLWTMRANAFAATVVKVQSGQQVIDTGPYAFVRHPMYAATLPFFAGLGLMLDSLAAALLAPPLFAIGFLPRMLIEEAALRRELSGYADYLSAHRWRLVPGLV